MSASMQYVPCPHGSKPPSSPICVHCFVKSARHVTEKETSGTHRSEAGVCPVCLNEYNTPNDENEVVEKPVRLSCGHRVGFHCLTCWLLPSPKGGNGSTCPICKFQLFKGKLLLASLLLSPEGPSLYSLLSFNHHEKISANASCRMAEGTRLTQRRRSLTDRSS